MGSLRYLFLPCLLVMVLASTTTAQALSVPILLYHRFGTTVADSMTVTTPVFESHLQYLSTNGYTVISLPTLIKQLQGTAKEALPPKPVVIVADDGHASVFTHMLPLVRRYQVPVTLFIYPSAISNANYAMTWDQLRDLRDTGLFEIQSHTYWHPNFKQEKKKLSSVAYERLVKSQLTKSKSRLEKELGRPIDLLAWPFGLFDEELLQQAAASGYVATFSIQRHPVTSKGDLMQLPRYLLVDGDRGPRFEAIVKSASAIRESQK